MGSNREKFVCRDCHHEFPVEESVKDASRKRGIMERCKPCDRDRKQEYRESEEHGEKQRVKVRDATRTARRERRAAGVTWHDHMTAEQLETHRAASRRHNRLKRWKAIGASQEYYDQQFEAQAGRCAICGSDIPLKGTGAANEVFCIDHDHLTAQLRGLLCIDCNLMIGHALDDPDRLAKGIAYLAAWGITESRTKG